MTIAGGADQAARLRQAGQIDTLVGRSAQRAASINETATLIGGIGQAAGTLSNWKTAPGAKVPPAGGGGAVPPPHG